MKVYRGRGLGDIYYDLIRDITNNGVEITTRGKRCLELPEPVTLIYDFPGYCWMQVPERKFNPFFAMAEVPWILSGNGNAEWISYFNKNMLTFLDEGLEELYGAYGTRIRHWDNAWDHHNEIDQIGHVVRKLKEDPFSRQAVIALWDPVRDNVFKSKDHPCNNLVYYRLRNGVLHQTTVIRSNDVVWGTPHNAIQFTHLHALLAGELGAKMGTFTYVVQNLHYYIDDTYSSTLGHIVNAACSEELLDAEKIDSFDVATEEDIRDCVCKVNEIRDFSLKNRPVVFDQSGYWRNLIPKLLWIYITVKSNSGASADVLAKIAASLPSPLPALIVDFWKDSTNPLAKELTRVIRSDYGTSKTKEQGSESS